MANEHEEWSKGRVHKCHFFDKDGTPCEEIAPFVCGARILCKDIGCKIDGKTEDSSRFCVEHRGNFWFLFLKKMRISAAGANESNDYLCRDHALTANSYAGIIFGIPLIILVIGAIACLVFDIIWIG